MPIIDVMFSEGTLDETQQEAVAARLTDILLEIEGTKGNPQFEAATWLTMQETPAKTFAVGGKAGAYPATYRIVVHVPEKTLRLEKKEAIVSRLTDAILEIEGTTPDIFQRARVYCLINEIADGGWGFAGNVYTLERLRAARSS